MAALCRDAATLQTAEGILTPPSNPSAKFADLPHRSLVIAEAPHANQSIKAM
jgi:hypothetical protein